MTKDVDWGRTGTLAAYAEWLRARSGALCVLVVRPRDSVFAVDPGCAPADAEALVRDYLPRLAGRVEEARREKKKAARLASGAGELREMG